jgi:hypothetical protein
MKYLLFVIFMLVSVPAFATEYTFKYNNVYATENNYIANSYEQAGKTQIGAKIDAPNLIRLTDNWTIGVEGSKDLYLTDGREGWQVYGKATYTGTWFDFRKK